MSGHNKWSKIKRQKAVEDSKKSKIFSKLSKKITIAAREGGGDPEMNPALSMLIDKAKEANMPKDNISAAVKKGIGASKDVNNIVEMVYEGYGPFGVALVIKTVTDNKNRTVSEIRKVLEASEGSLGTLGSASYVFDTDMTPTFEVPLDKESCSKIRGLIDKLEGLEDVIDIYANFKQA